MRASNTAAHRRLILTTAIVFSCLAAGAGRHDAAAAGLEGSGSNYGAHAGWAKTADVDEGKMLIGGHLELGLGPWLGVQGSIDYRSDDVLKVSVGGEARDVRVKTLPMMVTARLYLPAPGFSPFASAGVGWHRQVFDFPKALEDVGIDDRTRTELGWHVGLGARVPMARNVSLFGEGRYIFLDADGKLTGDVEEDLGRLDYDQTYLTAGVNLHF